MLSPGLSSKELSILLLLLLVLGYSGFQDHANCYSFLLFLSSCSFSAISHSWRVSHIIYFFPVDLGPPPIDHTGHYSSARPISHLPKPFLSCGNQGRTVQGSLDRKSTRLNSSHRIASRMPSSA